jgi:hypothetical protein
MYVSSMTAGAVRPQCRPGTAGLILEKWQLLFNQQLIWAHASSPLPRRNQLQGGAVQVRAPPPPSQHRKPAVSAAAGKARTDDTAPGAAAGSSCSSSGGGGIRGSWAVPGDSRAAGGTQPPAECLHQGKQCMQLIPDTLSCCRL